MKDLVLASCQLTSLEHIVRMPSRFVRKLPRSIVSVANSTTTHNYTTAWATNNFFHEISQSVSNEYTHSVEAQHFVVFYSNFLLVERQLRSWEMLADLGGVPAAVIFDTRDVK